MDDIYFDKKNKKDNNDIPTVNIPDSQIQEKYTTLDENFAPYRGKEKKVKEIPSEKSKVKKTYHKNKNKNKGCFKPIKIIAIILLICFCTSFVLISGAAIVSGYTKTKLENNIYVDRKSLYSNPFVRNILLLGVDGTDSSESLRSDSMILVSLDYLHGKIKLSSFMRDSWVPIPGYKTNKLNAACFKGGPQLVCDTIEYNFNVDIDDYVLVDFEMFTQIIDELGGVDVEITPAEAKFINRTTRHTVESGESIHLDGAKTLVYCRIRKLDSDYMRTYRQRKVIKALITKAKATSPDKLIDAVMKVLPKIKTNMNPFEIALLSYKAGFSALFFDIESTRIPTDDTSWAEMEGSQSVVELDIPANAVYLYNFIYSGSADPIDTQK